MKYIEEGKRGQGLWKFNTSLLENADFTNDLRSNIAEWKTMYNLEDKRVRWEIIKYEIRKFCISFSKRLTKEKKEKVKDLENELIELDRKLKNEVENQRYHEIKNDLLLAERENTKGLIVRSRTQWYEEGEKSTKYFFDLERANAIKKHVRKLRLDNNTEITDPSQILDEQKRFYQKLLSSHVQSSYVDPEFFNPGIPTLSEAMKQACEGEITILECENVLKSFKKNKSPGNDGLPVEFYITFWEDIKTVVVDSFNFAFHNGELSSSQKQAVISLFEKKVKIGYF